MIGGPSGWRNYGRKSYLVEVFVNFCQVIKKMGSSRNRVGHFRFLSPTLTKNSLFFPPLWQSRIDPTTGGVRGDFPNHIKTPYP